MQSVYVSDGFLLTSPLAQRLYQAVENLPIIDYHSHLEAEQIYHDHSYANITEAWLSADHYLWRAMRSVGVDEHFITGSASDKEKFIKWCDTMPKLLGSPLYQWCHLELARYFDLHLLINPENCEQIWQHCNAALATGALSPRQVLQRNRVKTLCTTDDPLSDLNYHRRLAQEFSEVQVLPTFRFDGMLNVFAEDAFRTNVLKLTTAAQQEITHFAQFTQALSERLDYFQQHGCRIADVGINQVCFAPYNSTEVDAHFAALIAGQALTETAKAQLFSAIFVFFGEEFYRRQWTMQLHLGVMMNVNQRRLTELGPGTGFSVMQDQPIIAPLAQLLSELDQSQQLPNTILYNLNPKDTWPLASLIGAFQDADCSAGKVQLGAGWWFNDHKHGMEQQLTALANLGALGCFVGMLTDSRNVFSLSRHEYFRRVLCNLLAQWAMEGVVPNDLALLQSTAANISFFNAQRYFQFQSEAMLDVTV